MARNLSVKFRKRKLNQTAKTSIELSIIYTVKMVEKKDTSLEFTKITNRICRISAK